MTKATLNVIIFSPFTLRSQPILHLPSDVDLSVAESVHVSSPFTQGEDHEAVYGKPDRHMGVWENSLSHR